jgi:hypothetical protein
VQCLVHAHFIRNCQVKKSRKHFTIKSSASDLVEAARLKDWVGSQHPLAGQFMQIVHNKAMMRCSALQIRRPVLTRLGVSIGQNDGFCPSCSSKGVGDGGYVSFDHHAKIRRHADGGCNFSAQCHSEVQREIVGSKPLHCPPSPARASRRERYRSSGTSSSGTRHNYHRRGLTSSAGWSLTSSFGPPLTLTKSYLCHISPHIRQQRNLWQDRRVSDKVRARGEV